MGDTSGHTTAHLQSLVERLQAGDETARNELITRAAARLHKMASQSLRRFPSVRFQGNETTDIAQLTAIELIQMLKSCTPDSGRGFLKLAATNMRRLLLSLKQKHAAPQQMPGETAGYDPKLATAGPPTLQAWTDFHEQIAKMPEDFKEVFDMIYYLQLPQAEAAIALGVDVRTIKRRWVGARLYLAERCELPDL